jgi:hypothetical protein
MVAGDARKRRLFGDVLRALADLQRDGFRNSSQPSPALSGRALSAYATTKQVKAEPAAPTHGAAEHSAVHTHARRGRRSPPRGGCTTKACSVPSKPSACKTCARQLPHARARACTPHARTRTVGGCVCVRACVRATRGWGWGSTCFGAFPARTRQTIAAQQTARSLPSATPLPTLAARSRRGASPSCGSAQRYTTRSTAEGRAH